MKLPLFPISAVFFTTVGLVLLSSSIQGNKSSDKLETFVLREKSAAAQNSSVFKKEEINLGYNLTYGWEDFNNKAVQISFAVSKQQLKEAEEEFGYYPEDLQNHLDQELEKQKEQMITYLKEFTRSQISRSKYSQYIFIDEVNPKSFDIKISVAPPLYKEVKAEFEKITKKLAKEQSEYYKKMEREQDKQKRLFLQSRGLRFIADKIGVNYTLSVRKNRSRVKQVVESMRKAPGKLSLRQLLGLMLSFIQEMRYGIPPFSEKNKLILGFWVPPKVLVNNFGDCDSKGVTFASMWINFKQYPLLLIKIPEHLFVGLAIPSSTQEGITVNGLRYTLCEVTGPNKIPPGWITQYSQLHLKSGNFVYELIK